MMDFGDENDVWYYTADIPDLSTFTMCGWVIVDNLSAGAPQGVMSISAAGSGNTRVSLVADNVPNEWGAWDNVNGWLRAGQAQENGVLVHVMVTYNAATTTRRFYYNNVQAVEDTSTSTISTGKVKLFVGVEDIDVGEMWTGSMHDLRLYSKELSEAERAEVYNNPNGIWQPRTAWIPVGLPAAGDVTALPAAGTITATGYSPVLGTTILVPKGPLW